MSGDASDPFSRGAGPATENTLRVAMASGGGALATEATLLAILAKDTSIDISADAINLNTDGLEALGTAGNLATASIDSKTPTVGQKPMATSSPVVIASDQSAVPVSAASLPLPTGASTAALQTQPGVDIGDVTVNNAAGAAAVNVQDGGNSITVDGTFFQATQPVSAASLPLPTGASTSAKQPALGTAGTPSADVISIQGVTNGTPVMVSTDGREATYRASILGLVPALTPTDIFEIAGSASKTVKIRKLRITGTRTASTTSDTVLLRRSTANTGGTSTTPTRVRHDTNDAAATAVVKAYTVNPTLGALEGNLTADKQFLNIAGTGIGDVREWVFISGGGEPITLRGVAEMVAINLNGVTMAGGSLDCWVEWSEIT